MAILTITKADGTNVPLPDPANIRGVYRMLTQMERGETKTETCFVTG